MDGRFFLYLKKKMIKCNKRKNRGKNKNKNEKETGENKCYMGG